MAKKKAAASSKSPRKFWLFKSEPDCFSIDDLTKAKNQTTFWDGVRNYQARNFLRDEIQVGDGVLFYHSSTDPMVVAGTAEVVRAGYADHTAFERKSDHYDEKSDPDDPTWFMVDIRLLKKFPKPVTREELKADKGAAGMMLLKRGSRLSIQPVTAGEWAAVLRLGGVGEA